MPRRKGSKFATPKRILKVVEKAKKKNAKPKSHHKVVPPLPLHHEIHTHTLKHNGIKVEELKTQMFPQEPVPQNIVDSFRETERGMEERMRRLEQLVHSLREEVDILRNNDSDRVWNDDDD